MLIKHFSGICLKKQTKIFIPLCGKTLDIKWLLEQNYEIVGIELNEEAIKSLFEELNIEASIYKNSELKVYSSENITIFVGDFFHLTKEVLGKVDFIYDRAALVALPRVMRKKYISHLMEITNKVPQLLISYEYDQNIMNGPPFCVDFIEIHEYYFELYNISLLEDNENIPSGLKRKSKANERVWLLKEK